MGFVLLTGGSTDGGGLCKGHIANIGIVIQYFLCF